MDALQKTKKSYKGIRYPIKNKNFLLDMFFKREKNRKKKKINAAINAEYMLITQGILVYYGNIYIISIIYMINSIHHKSESLQEAFPEVYSNFFLQHNLIISVPQVMHWGHSVTKNTIDFKIKQKLPTRMYGGVNIVSEKTVKINNLTFFSCIKNQYNTIPLENIIEKKELLEKVIVSKLQDYGFDYGLEIDILSENERGHGISFSGILNTLLAIIIQVVSEKAPVEVVQDYEHFISSGKINEIVELCAQIDKELGGNPTGVTAYTAMLKNGEPIVNLENKFLSMSDLMQVKEITSLPIDYGIIYYGLPYDGTHIEGIYKNRLNDYQNTLTYQTKVSGLPTKKKKEKTDPFIDIALYLNSKLVSYLEELINNPYDEQAIESFIDIVSEHGIYNCFIEKEKDLWINTNYLFTKARLFDDEAIGITPISSGKLGGCFLFVTKKQKSRETMMKLLELLANDAGYTNATYEYLSREDGFSHEGLIIEQYIDQKVYSQYIQEGNVVLQKNDGSSYLGDHSSIIESEKNGILLDTIDKKIYIKGQRLNHRDICSQSGTIEILNMLIRNIGKYVKNSQLPESSYSKNKNEMLGKIILPMQDLTEKYFNQKIPLKCSGSIYEFNVVLEKSPIEIAMIKKIAYK